MDHFFYDHLRSVFQSHNLLIFDNIVRLPWNQCLELGFYFPSPLSILCFPSPCKNPMGPSFKKIDSMGPCGSAIQTLNLPGLYRCIIPQDISLIPGNCTKTIHLQLEYLNVHVSARLERRRADHQVSNLSSQASP